MRFIIPLIVLFSIGAQAQEHNRHPVRDLALHEKFYSTWHMPDNPTKSCCNMADCYPTEIKIIDGKQQHEPYLLALRRDPLHRAPAEQALAHGRRGLQPR